MVQSFCYLLSSWDPSAIILLDKCSLALCLSKKYLPIKLGFGLE